MRKNAVWRKRGKPDLHGVYEWYWAGGFFHVWLDAKDPVTGQGRYLRVYDDDISFNGYRLAKDAALSGNGQEG